MRLAHQVVESIERAMQPFVRQHSIQARNREQDEEQQNEDGDNNLDERETALMPHPGILRCASQITIWLWNTAPCRSLPPTNHTKYPKIIRSGGPFWTAVPCAARHRFGAFPVFDALRNAFLFVNFVCSVGK